jgi:hypothetical protein
MASIISGCKSWIEREKRKRFPGLEASLRWSRRTSTSALKGEIPPPSYTDIKPSIGYEGDEFLETYEHHIQCKMPRWRSRCSINIYKNCRFFALRFLCEYVPSIRMLHLPHDFVFSHFKTVVGL